jgi:IS605 OrfB family transposase
MKVMQAYRFALDPTPGQERALCSHAGASRFAWNWGLAKCIGRYEAEGRWHSGIELHRLWNAEKKTDPALAWWGENSKCAHQESFRDLDRALKDFVKSKKGRRKGRRLGFPRFKKRGKCRDSFRFSTGVMRCGRIHARVANVRADSLHKATTALSARYEMVVIEDLNVAGMTRNRRLARAISDQGFGQARRMLEYKTSWNGGRVIAAGRWFPSSKTCSACGTVKATLSLSERVFRCGACGLVTDRDVNAACNLLHLAVSGTERRNACGGILDPAWPGTSR